MPVKAIRTHDENGHLDGIDDYNEAMKVTTIVIPEGVEVIGDFCDFPNLTTVILPSSLKCISAVCFGGLEKLRSITLPEGLVAIDDSAFMRTGLTSVSLPKNLKYLGPNAFDRCDSLEEINIPDDLSVVIESESKDSELKYKGNLYLQLNRYSEFSEWDFTKIFSGEKIKESINLQKMLRTKKTVSLDYQQAHKYNNTDCTKWDW